MLAVDVEEDICVNVAVLLPVDEELDEDRDVLVVEVVLVDDGDEDVSVETLLPVDEELEED